MRKLILSAIAGTAALVATPAFAQDDAASFNGGHVEAITGYDHITDGSDGVLYGIGGGYDYTLSLHDALPIDRKSVV